MNNINFLINHCFVNSNTPKPVFHVNGKKSYYQKNHQESISAQHQEIIKYIHECM